MVTKQVCDINWCKIQTCDNIICLEASLVQISISRQVWILGFLRAGFYKLRARLRYIYLSQSDIQIFYGLKVVNGIWQCVNNI